jgi:hypothetical protein
MNNENMIDIGGTTFIIDLERYGEVISSQTEPKGNEVETKETLDSTGTVLSTVTTSREYDRAKEIDAPKYDLLRMCLEIILTYDDEIDDSMGLTRGLEKTTISFKVAYNTLLNYGILKEVESE